MNAVKKISKTVAAACILALAPLPAYAGTDFDLNLGPEYILRLDGITANTGYTGAAAGDLNADGIDDLVLGSGDMSSYVFYGPIPYSTGTVRDLNIAARYNVLYTGSSPMDTLRVIADLNNDGKKDLLLQKSYPDYYYYAHFSPLPSGTGLSRDIATDADMNFNIGYPYYRHVGAGDFNGDGKQDVAISDPGETYSGRSYAGCVHIKYGPFSTGVDINMNTADDVRYCGSVAYEYLQAPFSADLNNDGQDDLIIVAGDADPDGRTDAGIIYVIYGPITATGQTSVDLSVSSNWNVKFKGKTATSYLGSGYVYSSQYAASIAKGDFNNDGITDIAFGAKDSNNGADSGSVYIYTGPLPAGPGNVIDLASDTSFKVRFDGYAANEYFGLGVPAVADFNSDGIDDIAIPAGYADTLSRTENGAAYVILGPTPGGTGNTRPMSTTANWYARIGGRASYDHCGGYGPGDIISLATGDFDADGVPDLVIPCPALDTQGRTDNGGAYVFSFARARLTAPGLFSSTNTPNLQWNAVGGASSYQIQIATTPLFSTILVNKTGLSGTSYKLTGTTPELLDNAQSYYTRMKAENGTLTNWGPVFNITIDTTAPTVPTLISPADKATIQTQTPALDWSDSTTGPE